MATVVCYQKITKNNTTTLSATTKAAVAAMNETNTTVKLHLTDVK